MKLGIISDIHADLERLQLALELLDSKGGAEIVCAGDLVSKGDNGDAVVRLIQSRSVLSVAGTHDTKANLHERFEPDVVEFLQSLPGTRRLVREGKRILIAHGVPWSDTVYLFPTSEHHVFRRVAHESETDVLILVHT